MKCWILLAVIYKLILKITSLPKLNLHINTEKTTTTLFTQDPAEYGTTLSLKLNNQTLPITKHPKILGITLDPKLTFSQHINVTITKAKQTLNIIKALTVAKWGKKKELIVSTFKAITCPILEYANTEPYHIKHQHQETANHSKHSFANCYWLHMRYKHSTPTRRNQGPSHGHSSQTSYYSI